jgi:hypothetical protein
MKRPSGLAIGVIAGIVALVVTEVIVWWPETPKKRAEEPPQPMPVAVPQAAAPAPPPPSLPTAELAHPGRTVRPLQANEHDELRRLEGCADKHCGDPCIFRCDPGQDGRCVDGRRPGACTVDGECSTTLPAVCPTPGESPP